MVTDIGVFWHVSLATQLSSVAQVAEQAGLVGISLQSPTVAVAVEESGNGGASLAKAATLVCAATVPSAGTKLTLIVAHTPGPAGTVLVLVLSEQAASAATKHTATNESAALADTVREIVIDRVLMVCASWIK